MSASSRPASKDLRMTLKDEWLQKISPAIETAVQYFWNEETLEWDTRCVQIIMEEKRFKQGGMRIVHKTLMLEGDQMLAGVTKFFKYRTESSSMIFADAMAQILAHSYALRFNKALKSYRQIKFSPISVLRLSQRNGQIVSFEPYLSGRFVKHSDNSGKVETSDELPQAFSHFTWQASNQNLLVCGIQGVDDIYTDPQIHSIDGEDFGRGDKGFVGIQNFFRSHKCGSMCSLMGLHKVDPGAIRSDSSSVFGRLKEHDFDDSSQACDGRDLTFLLNALKGNHQRDGVNRSSSSTSSTEECSCSLKGNHQRGGVNRTYSSTSSTGECSCCDGPHAQAGGRGTAHLSAAQASRVVDNATNVGDVDSDCGRSSALSRGSTAARSRATSSTARSRASSTSSSRGHTSKSRSTVAKVWSTSKAFGKALIGANKQHG